MLSREMPGPAGLWQTRGRSQGRDPGHLTEQTSLSPEPPRAVLPSGPLSSHLLPVLRPLHSLRLSGTAAPRAPGGTRSWARGQTGLELTGPWLRSGGRRRARAAARSCPAPRRGARPRPAPPPPPPGQRHCGSAGASRGWRGAASGLRAGAGIHRPTDAPATAPGRAGQGRRGRAGCAPRGMGAPGAPGHRPAAARRPGRGGSGGRGSSLAAAAEPPRGP